MARKTEIEKLVRSRYARTARQIRERVSQLEQEAGDVASVQRYKMDFKPLGVLGKNVTLSDLRKATKRAESLLSSAELSLDPQERAFASGIATLREDYGINITEDNARAFFDFLDDARARGLAAIYGSGELASMYDQLQERDPGSVINALDRAVQKGLTPQQIQANIFHWSEHPEKRMYVKAQRRSSKKRFKY